MRQESGKPIHEKAIQHVLLEQTPNAVEREARKRHTPGNIPDGIEDESRNEQCQRNQHQNGGELAEGSRRRAPAQAQRLQGFPVINV
jgi:hypothetical protein